MLGKATRTGSLMAVMMVAGMLSPVGTAQAAVDNACFKHQRPEVNFKNKINAERKDLGLGKLKIDPELSKVARHHTKAMLRADEGLFHQTSEQFRKRITGWTRIGENVGYGSKVSSLHSAFMDSPGHAANVLGPGYTHVGVGVKYDEDDRMWVTVIFSGVNNPGTTLPMPTC